MSMTNQQVVPEALRLADWVESVVGGPHAKQCAAELCRQHSENETLHAERERNLNSIRVCNEIINKKNAELESLRTGYAAARLEIESLQARIKTMAEEHADDLMVAHLDGRMRAAQPAGAGQRRSDLVPGVMHCAKCKFQLNRVTLCVSDGNAYAGNNETEPCPNGCGPLWPVTWEQEARNCWKALEEMHERLHPAPTPQAAPAAVDHDEDLLEKLYWEFDSQRKKTGEERLAFKVKMRFYASEFLRRSNGKMTFAQSVSDDMMNLADRLGSEFDDVDPRAWKHLLVYAPKAAPAAVAGPSEFPHEQMDALALARYKVVPSHESMFHRHAVVAGDGSQQLYIGREVECQNIVRKFAGAFLDGAFAFHSMLAAAPTPPAQTADSVLEDAARYRFLAAHCRSTSEHWGGRWSIVVDGPAPKSHDSEDDFDAAIDAAMNKWGAA